MNILLVDDDPAYIELVKIWLKFSNHKFTTAMNGFDAIKQCQNNQYDLLITDLSMPEMSGIKLATYIKDKYHIPVVINTYFQEYLNLEMDVDAIVNKPYSKEVFLKLIKAFEVLITVTDIH